MPTALYRVQTKPIHMQQFLETVKKTPGMVILDDIPLKIPAYKAGWSEDCIRKNKFLKHYLVKFRSQSSASEFILKYGKMSKRPYHGVERFYFNGVEEEPVGNGVVHDNYYYWTHPKEYKRLKIEDLKDDPTLLLCEMVLVGFRKEMDRFLATASRFGSDSKTRDAAREFKLALGTQFMEAITFGKNRELLREFEERLPKGVVD